MMKFALIGIGAGAATALLFASVTSGALLSIPLFYLAPLPILIAGLGWSHWAALIAAIAAALALGIAFGPVFFVSFIAVVGLPAWWLGYLAMLARPARNGARRARMVSAGAAGGVGGAARRAGGGRRHPEFRARRRELPRRPAPNLDPRPAHRNRCAGGQPARCAGRRQRRPSDRFPGRRHSAVGGGGRAPLPMSSTCGSPPRS